ncbi:hypothetical protein KFE25_006059 [Diacronema lutheri]|uniref:WW domain-containing protein n=3 Tax=Diacronema lutheri TaxID=2081491 RepID=A0A8J5XSA9_DIALT|nr:hypothetical protein KFE25_006059 [Diacronema lutheri]
MPSTDDAPQADAFARLDDGIAAANALIGSSAGSCSQVAWLTRAHAELASCDESHRAERTAAALAEHLRHAQAAAEAAAAQAEAELLGATIGATARVAAAAAESALRAAELGNAQKEWEATSHAKLSRVALLDAGLKKGLTVQVKRDMSAQHREAQEAQAKEVARLEAECHEASEAANTRNLKGDRRWSDTGGRMTHSQTKPVIQALKRSEQLQEQLAAAKLKLADLTAKARATPTSAELEAFLRKVYSAKEFDKAEAAARSKLGVAEKAAKRACEELAAANTAAKHEGDNAAVAVAALSAAEADAELLRPGPSSALARIGAEVEERVRVEMAKELEAADMAATDGTLQLRAHLAAAFSAVAALVRAEETSGRGSTLAPPERVSSEVLAGVAARHADEGACTAARYEALACLAYLDAHRRRAELEAAEAAVREKAAKHAAKERAAAERAAKRAAKAAEEAAARHARHAGPSPRELLEPSDSEGGDDSVHNAPAADVATTRAQPKSSEALAEAPPPLAVAPAAQPMAQASQGLAIPLVVEVQQQQAAAQHASVAVAGAPAPPVVQAAQDRALLLAAQTEQSEQDEQHAAARVLATPMPMPGRRDLPAPAAAVQHRPLDLWDVPPQQMATRSSLWAADFGAIGPARHAPAAEPSLVATSQQAAAHESTVALFMQEPLLDELVAAARSTAGYAQEALSRRMRGAEQARIDAQAAAAARAAAGMQPAAPIPMESSPWQAVPHVQSGKTYWWNRATNETRWVKPTQAVWNEVHADSGKTYWWNVSTGETSWEVPKALTPYAVARAR